MARVHELPTMSPRSHPAGPAAQVASGVASSAIKPCRKSMAPQGATCDDSHARDGVTFAHADTVRSGFQSCSWGASLHVTRLQVIGRCRYPPERPDDHSWPGAPGSCIEQAMGSQSDLTPQQSCAQSSQVGMASSLARCPAPPIQPPRRHCKQARAAPARLPAPTSPRPRPLGGRGYARAERRHRARREITGTRR